MHVHLPLLWSIAFFVSPHLTSTSSLQGVIHGVALSRPTEIEATVTGLRSLATHGRFELALDRVCRADITHPDCPKSLAESRIDGRLPGNLWAEVRERLLAEQTDEGATRSTGKAYVYVQRPVGVGDSIVMLVQMIRQRDGQAREWLFFDIVLRGDSAKMEAVRVSQRSDQPIRRRVSLR